jgi:hypothetical protein
MQDWPIGRGAIRVQHQPSSMTGVIRPGAIGGCRASSPS